MVQDRLGMLHFREYIFEAPRDKRERFMRRKNG